jgi:hypothetical protein
LEKNSNTIKQEERISVNGGQWRTDSGWSECVYTEFDWSEYNIREPIGDRREEIVAASVKHWPPSTKNENWQSF